MAEICKVHTKIKIYPLQIIRFDGLNQKE